MSPNRQRWVASAFGIFIGADSSTRQVTDLFLLVPASLGGDASLLWADPDLGNDDPIMLDAEMDLWEGDEVMELALPWLLITRRAYENLASASLTGLRVAPLPTLRFSNLGTIRANLGEFVERVLPAFCLARPETETQIANNRGDVSWVRGDTLQYWDWTGHDFSSSHLGTVITGRARSILEQSNIPHCEFILVHPR